MATFEQALFNRTGARGLGELLVVPPEELEHDELVSLVSMLLARCPGGNVRLDGPLDGHAALLVKIEDVPPGARHQYAVRSYMSFEATRVVFLDVAHEQENVETVETVAEVPSFWWWRRTITRETTTRRTTRLVVAPASAWELYRVFSGAQCVFPPAQRLLQDQELSTPLQALWADGATVGFDVAAGTDVSVEVSHRLARSASLKVVILGRLPKKVNTLPIGAPR